MGETAGGEKAENGKVKIATLTRTPRKVGLPPVMWAT